MHIMGITLSHIYRTLFHIMVPGLDYKSALRF